MAGLGGAGSADITLYSAGTPNGWKASICLEELELQKEDWYLAINPNGRIPAIVDHRGGDLPVFESGAVLLHLAEQDPQHRLLPADKAGRAEVLSWLFWQVGGLGPMAGQADWFLVYAPERSELAISRYVNEVQRLFSVMEKRLEGQEWLAAGQFSIADVAAFPWVLLHDLWGISLAAFYPNLRRWVDAIKARPTVQRGLNVPETNMVLGYWQHMLERAKKGLEGVKPFPEPEE
ncbi:hypothetical protein CHLNCDRAFT_137523 [Chlorella variabilis]|uniref:Glutathione S-transferase n=1 Tax=Chlorella variabilis TaxID=554065 RepID=E1ZMM3_CHLVA|nr:hypothetical protein CHLNCDRAFT_137523 [Chlorella variabilis]EFN53025.1 hypothetical protein CHLNCDRAFT_137523 [Chlorella variabilis]|eukprot:XP_005845127.1 hypothetical protein CHLNCDRAFT_137523 [Chlorella variabilis]